MSIPFVKYLDTRLSASDLTKITTKAEYKALESIRRHENGILAISENMLEGLREAITKKHGESQEAAEFDTHLTRAYVAFHLRRYSERLEPHFSKRSWDSWLAETRSMGAVALGKAQQITGVDLTTRPTAEAIGKPQKARPAKKAPRPDPVAIRKDRYEKLCEVVQSENFAFRINSLTDDIKYEADEFKVMLLLRKNFVEITVDADHDELACYEVDVNEEMFVTTFNTAVEAVDNALDELEDCAEAEEEEEEKVKKAPSKSKAAVPTKPTARLLAALKATDPDDVTNYIGYSNPTAHVFLILDDDGARVLRITVSEDSSRPYQLDLITGNKKDYGSFAKETAVLQKAWDILEKLWEDDNEEEEDEDEVPKRGAPKSVNRKKASLMDNEEYANIFSPFALARCPALLQFSAIREEMMREADGDEDDVTSMYGRLREIAEHYLTRIMSTFWPESFNFELVDPDEEEPIYRLSVDAFNITFKPDAIVIVEHHERGDITLTRRMVPSDTERDRLDTAMRYFDTWSSERIREMLEYTGFVYHIGDTRVFRSNDEQFAVVDSPDKPRLFYTDDNDHIDQIQTSEAFHQFSEYLRDCVGCVRGVDFKHHEDQHYALGMQPGISLPLIAVGSNTADAEHVRLVADSHGSGAFYTGWDEGQFTLDTLRNKGMVVTEASGCVTLEFNYQNLGFLIHIYR